MSNKDYDEEELNRINQEIEDELNAYESEKDFNKEKKEFLTIKFICTLILVLLMIGSLVKLFL
ncbi:hypothetical protein [Staphylococcus caeli]|uniref:hypothetical protein n=1 Tax=Staphylococcus caeli TaxID=2201815 RepID=UPI003F55E9B6